LISTIRIAQLRFSIGEKRLPDIAFLLPLI
jgi:hypothetical protein